MKIRRCSILFAELREDVEFDLDSLLVGGAGLVRRQRWIAIAPHISGPVEVNSLEMTLLGSLSPTQWCPLDTVPKHVEGCVDRMAQCGLVIMDDEFQSQNFEQDAKVRDRHWWPASALFHHQGRWKGVDGVRAMEENDLLTATGLRKRFGPPPSHVTSRGRHGSHLPLKRLSRTRFDELLARRATCRNFGDRTLAAETFAAIMDRVFAAQAQIAAGEDAVFLKKTSPSGGGLHATEAYLIVQNVEGIAPGFYHYHPVDHALEPLPDPDMPLAEFAKLALAGQHWFANAPVLVVLAPRFARSFWKYRHHAKAYRALILDSGHLSQTLYLSATDLGLGAFVTSAINEIDIEQAFGMDPLEESPLAICGFGWRAERMETAEFDPAGEVWEPAESSGDTSL